MSILYEKISQLCEQRGVTRYKMCKEIGMQPSILTDLKMGRQSGLSASKNAKVLEITRFFGFWRSCFLYRKILRNIA